MAPTESSEASLRAVQRVVSALGATLLLQSCCGVEPSGACIPWVREGDSYDVELLRLVDETYPRGSSEAPPFSRYPRELQSCGAGLDLDEGSRIRIRVGAKTGPTDDQCAAGCYEYRARTEVDGVEVAGDARAVLTIGEDYFLDQSRVEVRAGCSGIYTVGVMPVEDAFRARRPDITGSDYLLFREFTPDDGSEECEAQGSALSASPDGRCYDVWFIRVTDSSGDLVTQDIRDAGPRA